MSVTPNNGAWRSEDLTEAVMASANDHFIKALRTGETTSRDLVWSIPPGNFTTRGIALAQDAERAASTRAIRERALSRRIESREPCVRCGVRGDIGCKHRVAA